MSVLHTINKSPFEKNSLDACLARAKEGSGVLLIEDGVYAALGKTSKEGTVKSAMAGINFYVLGPDLKARGLAEESLIEGVGVVDYDGFVDLTIQYDKVKAWL